MAIAGDGVPAKRIYIHRRQIATAYPMHNVWHTAIKTPSEAAELLACGESCYIESVGDHEAEVWRLLQAMGLVDKMQTAREWLLSVVMKDADG